MDYTIIGGEVNLAARLQAHAEVGGIFIAHETYALVQDEVMAVEQPPISVKGFARPIRCYAVKGSQEEFARAGGVVQYSGTAGTIQLKLDRLDDEERSRLQEAIRSLLRILEREPQTANGGLDRLAGPGC